MSSLVLELQQKAIDEKVNVSDILRKALVVASKLHIDEFRDWIDKELNGYRDDDKLPEYRAIRGEMKARDDYGQWIPFQFRDVHTNEVLSRRYINQPIGQIEQLIEKDNLNTSLAISYPSELLESLNSSSIRNGIIPVLMVSRATLYGVIDAVRNAILKWSLKLESDKILGDGLTFTKEEQQRASTITYNIQNFAGVLGNVQTTNLQIGDYNSIHADLKQLGISQKERNELEEILDLLKTSPKAEEKEPLLQRGVDWLLRNGSTIGVLAETIRSWFEKLSG
jgi:hypothetical protein